MAGELVPQHLMTPEVTEHDGASALVVELDTNGSMLWYYTVLAYHHGRKL